MGFEKFMSARFNPTLSWDGVAIIGSCACALLWFGTIRETIKQHGEVIKHHEELLQSLSEGQKLISQNIAILQTLVNERTGIHTVTPKTP